MVSIYEPGSGSSPGIESTGALYLNFPSHQTPEKWISVFDEPTNYGILL